MSTYDGIWRSPDVPPPGVPLAGRSCGRAVLDKGWVHGTGTLHWTNLYWGYEGNGAIVVNGERTRLPANHIAMHYADDTLSGIPSPEAWCYRWITFDGALADSIVEGLDLHGPWPRYAGACPHALFDRMACELRQLTPNAALQASQTAYAILAEAARGIRRGLSPSPQSIIEQCKAEIDRNFSDTELSVETLAVRFELHRSRLSRLFKTAYGCPPADYLQRLRLQEGLSRLRSTQTSVKEIAFACGFADAAYFSRCVRAVTGQPPSAYRTML